MSTSVGTDSEAQPVGKPDGLLAVQVSQAVAAPLTHVWEVLVGPLGSQALLGEGAVLGAKGEPYHCADGSSGVVRSYHPLEQLRVSWHETPDSPPSIVEVDLYTDIAGTTVKLRHERFLDESLHDALERRWVAALYRVAAVAEA